MLDLRRLLPTSVRILLGLAASFSVLGVSHAADPTCLVSYASIEALANHEGRQPLDRLIAFENLLEKVEKSLDGSIHQMQLSASDLSKLAKDRHAMLTDIRVRYDRLADDVLSENPDKLREFEPGFADLRKRLADSVDFTKRVPGAIVSTTTHRFDYLIENPSMVKAGTPYEVPQAAGAGGEASAQKLSATFSQDVIDYFNADATRGSRFLRAIQKGYVPSGSGSGIVRITDQHEKLVEIKVIGGNEGHQRLIGCRQADGLLQILKV